MGTFGPHNGPLGKAGIVVNRHEPQSKKPHKTEQEPGPDVLRVLLDATAIPDERGGVGRYVDNLAAALVRHPEVHLTVACQARDAESFASSGAEVAAVSHRLDRRPLRLAWEQTSLPRLARSHRAEVLHCPHYTMPLRRRPSAGNFVPSDLITSPLPTVVTLHDATFFTDPQLHSAAKARFFRAATRVAVRRADALVVPSEATRQELVRLLGPRAERAIVAHHGVDPSVFRPPTAAEVAELRAQLGLGTVPFLAFLGTLEPRKNVPALINAWRAACESAAQPPVLVLAGAPGWDDDVEAAIRAATPLRVVRAGYLPLELIPALLGGADLLCYPALGEGFGLPVLEAMACGAAVLTTRRLALPEVGGDAVEYSEPDAASISQALVRLLGSPARRAELRELGRRRAAQFSWDATAAAHLKAYRGALDSSTRPVL